MPLSRPTPVTAYYRVARSGNGKPRPDWFSPRTAMRSFLAAAERIDATVVVVADGGVPDEVRDLVPGRVVPVRGGSAAKGFRRLLDVAGRDVRRGTARGLVWFAEDDYVYRPEALEAVVGLLDAEPRAAYVGVYTPDNAAWHADHASQPAVDAPEHRLEVDGRAWRRAWDSTSTFGVRAQVLREDAELLRLCSRAGGPWDHTCVLAVQGRPPYPVHHLYDDLYLRWSRASAGRVVSRPLVRAALDLAARSRSRHWYAPVQDLATHAEPGYVAPGTDWAAVAATAAPAAAAAGVSPGRRVRSVRT